MKLYGHPTGHFEVIILVEKEVFLFMQEAYNTQSPAKTGLCVLLFNIKIAVNYLLGIVCK